MLSNREIAKSLNFLGKLMELHGENGFKVRSYYNAYNNLRKVETPFAELSDLDLGSLPAIGDTIIDKIRELVETGKLAVLEKYKSITPVGVQQMLGIRGIGPKKVHVIWKDIGIDDIGDLLYACNENRLVKYKGFGLKTQELIKTNVEYFLASQGKFHYARVIDVAIEFLKIFKEKYPESETELVGDLARKMPEVKGIELITSSDNYDVITLGAIPNENTGELEYKGFPLYIDYVDIDVLGTEMFMRNSSKEFIEACGISYDDLFAYEEDIFDELQIDFVVPEYRETSKAYDEATNGSLPTLIELKDIKGVVHNHSTYSDGLHSLEQMTQHCIKLGYEYFVISDHSQSAFYANGLKEDRILQQWDEIDNLNKKYPDFKIYKGIESDILNDGSLDYDESILKGFDVIIASIHGNLNMDIDKATSRLITAIENPYTRILGHPTGRLLLGRKGYPIDHKKIIDAASQNGVSVELNANPQRLDIDWKWIDYAMSKDVLISINPDAHSMDQIEYIKYGVAVARKGGLTEEYCLNSKSLSAFEKWLKN